MDWRTFTGQTADFHLITGLSPTTVKSAIRELEEAGLIEHQSGTSRAEPSRYRICNVVGKRPAKLPEQLPDKQPDKLPEYLPVTPINSNEDKSVKDKEKKFIDFAKYNFKSTYKRLVAVMLFCT